jgi:hypothetical protein
MELKNREWKAFLIGKIFTICSTSSGIDKKKLINCDGNIPYITRTDKNNGYDMFVGTQVSSYTTDNKNVITIGLDTQTVFYQESNFYTGQNIQIISFQELNKYNACFLIPLLKKQMTKFSWGGNGATLTRLKKTKILLPINSKGEPDYAFMENYMRQKEIELLQQYKKQVPDFESLVPLSEKKWRAFFIENIFEIKSGKRLVKKNMISGNIPFVGATDSNNGITEFVANKNSSLDKNVLGVNYNGSVAYNFYHSYEAIFSDDVKRLSFKNSEGNMYSFLFVKALILQQKSKYEYGYKFNGERMKRQKILLPVNSKNEPDYIFMENYMKAMKNEKLKRYFEYRKQKQ